MKFHANYGDTEALQLKAALLLYGGSKGIRFASVHEPLRDQSGAPYLDSGRAVTVDFLRTLAQELGMLMRAEVLPAEVLVRTPECTVWWVPAATRTMFFSANCDGKSLSGKSYPHPPLVFSLLGNQHLAVRALLVNERPGRNSQVAIAPYWNTSVDGGVCLGSMRTPQNSDVNALDAWVDGFFKSEFTHSNATKLTSHPEGHLGLWRDLAEKEHFKEHFPAGWLIPAGTLERWVCELR
jgi:PRTRC genetic system protein B